MAYILQTSSNEIYHSIIFVFFAGLTALNAVDNFGSSLDPSVSKSSRFLLGTDIAESKPMLSSGVESDFRWISSNSFASVLARVVFNLGRAIKICRIGANAGSSQRRTAWMGNVRVGDAHRISDMCLLWHFGQVFSTSCLLHLGGRAITINLK